MTQLQVEAMVLILFFLLLPLLGVVVAVLMKELALKELARVVALGVAEDYRLVQPLVERERQIKVLLVVAQLLVLREGRYKVVVAAHHRLGLMVVLGPAMVVMVLLHLLQAHL
jgi:hypothetical protein